VSEVANVFQIGYRARTARVLTWSITGFHHQWDKLRSAPAPPVFFENKIEGAEGWASWQVVRPWRITGGMSTLRKDLRLEPGSTDLMGPRNPQLSNDPKQQWMLRSFFSFSTNHELDAAVRHVGKLPNPTVPAYTAVDARYAWRVRQDLELSLLGQNLFDRAHAEFNPAPNRSEFERDIFLQARWSR
jgi:iron complex outermembrane receptor protein